MYGKDVALFCLAYILGLLIAAGIKEYWLTLLIFGLVTGALLWKFVSHHQWWGLRSRSLLVIILITIVSFVYFNFRFPILKSNDISQVIPPETNGISLTVVGKVINSPTLNRSGKLRFWLDTETVKNNYKNTVVEGKLYATIPATLEKEIPPSSKIEITGYLYQPSTPINPGQFNFKEYLKRNAAFAGISGRKITVIQKNNWGFWRLRDRVVNVHQNALGSPKGELVSSMVLGRKAVNLPYDIQDQFLQSGLAHILAASGFHVSLLLGVVLGITRQLKVSLRFAIGIGVLLLYVGLTGLQPSILRASLMGVAGLLGLLTERKVNSTRSLLVIATILLLINPLWVIDLGFQFSFLATLGLIVTLPVLLEYFDFIPPTLTSFIAVPIAVFPWVFPLQLFHFGTFATYSILLNVIATPFAVLIILGGMISGLIGLIIPELGSAIAQLLFYPTQWLMTIVSAFNQLPGSYLLFGQLALWQLLIVSSIIILIWQSSHGKQYWKLAAVVAILVIIIPITYKQLAIQKVTVFATKEPIIFIQNNGRTTLINCGNEETIRYTLIPFLQTEGIQNIHTAISLNPNNQWQMLENKIKLGYLFYTPTFGEESKVISKLNSPSKQIISTNTTLMDRNNLRIETIDQRVLKITLRKEQWTFLQSSTDDISSAFSDLKDTDILVWEGKELDRSWLEQLNLKSAIAVTNQVSDELQNQINQKGINFYFTGKDGAIQWTPEAGLKTWLD